MTPMKPFELTDIPGLSCAWADAIEKIVERMSKSHEGKYKIQITVTIDSDGPTVTSEFKLKYPQMGYAHSLQTVSPFVQDTLMVPLPVTVDVKLFPPPEEPCE